MKLSVKKLKEILVKPGFITEKQFRETLEYAAANKKILEEALVEKGFITEEHLGRIIAESQGYNFVELSKKAIPQETLRIIPELVAKIQKVIAFSQDKDGIKLAMANPENYEMIEWLEKKTGQKIIPHYATPNDIRAALKNYHKELKEEFEEIIKKHVKGAKIKWLKPEDISIIKIVDTLIQYAYENRASDIHIEPREKKVEVRYRIDGILHNVITLPKNLHDLVITRIKVLSRLRTDEHMVAQDGKFQAKFDGGEFDIRVSIVPITDGEKAVLRLLAESSRRFSLEELGMGEKDLKKVKDAVEKPFGMILATGPTGCGKTTTLYAVLKILNKPEVNIATIEDPVEYDIEGVNQIQVNPKAKLTFASGLRSIVRQDPNIIMVGEIRDEETAGIAINSAMTGHLVLSTLHTINAATTLPRLLDMKIEPFLVASSVNVVIAQRLVRKICSQCIESYSISPKETELIKRDPYLVDNLERITGKTDFSDLRLYRGKGCKTCAGIGYTGRIGIFEVMEIEENIRDLIMQKANADEIDKEAKKHGMTSMFYDGTEKVLAGVTTLEELLRVMRE